jgi:hypothetical protein
LPVTFSIVSGPATNAGDTITLTGAGTVTIRASQAGNNNFNPAPDADQSFTVDPAAITVTADAKSKTYGATDPALTWHLTGGSLVSGDSFTGDLTRVAGENVGAHAILQGTLTAGANYNLTYTGADLTIGQKAIAVTADPQSKTYGDTDPALTWHLTGGSLVSGDSFTGDLTRVAGQNVGAHAILQGTLTAGANYNLTYTGADLTISQKAIAVTADPKSKVYGDADPALTWQLTGGSLVSGDSFTGDLTRVAGQNVGAHAILQGTLTAGANYNLTYTGADLTITPANSANALISSENPSPQGSNVTFTATLTPVSPATTTPTGDVQFFTNGVALGGPVALAGGVASISTAQLPPGSNTVKAVYAGSTNFQGSTNSLVQVVTLYLQTPSTLGIKNNGDGTVTITFAGTPEGRYVVQATANFAPVEWTNVSTNTAATDGQWTFTDSMTTHSQRFYRSAKP